MSQLINAILEESEDLFIECPSINNKQQINAYRDHGWGDQWVDKTIHDDHWEDVA